MFQLKPTSRVAVLSAIATLPGLVLAQSADYGAAAAITATQTTVLAIIGGFIAMGIAVWGAMYILRRFFPKGR